MRLLKDLTLVRSSGPPKTKSGTTCGKEQSFANVYEWELHPTGRPKLTVHDSHWQTGERDLVLCRPPLVPEMPAALANLHNRLRSGISDAPDRQDLRIMLYPTYVDTEERPRIKKSFKTEALERYVEARRLRELTTRANVTLELVPDLKGLQYGLFFPADDEETPVAAFVHFRIVPVLRHVGWLSPEEEE